MAEKLPPLVRPWAFAQGELLLELLYLLEHHYRLDLESLLILLCVNDATMRPVMTAIAEQPELLCIPEPPESIRGSISRAMIADKTGLPRETVRRKTAALIKAGRVVIDENGGVKMRASLEDPAMQALLKRGDQAIRQYIQRMEKFENSGAGEV